MGWYWMLSGTIGIGIGIGCSVGPSAVAPSGSPPRVVAIGGSDKKTQIRRRTVLRATFLCKPLFFTELLCSAGRRRR